MAKWRDVKKGKVEKESKIQQKLSLSNATLTNRTKAFLTDIFMIMMPLMYLVSYVVIGSLEEFSHNRALGWVYILVPHFIITVSFWYFKGQTPGLKAYELSLVDCNTQEKPSIIASINRYIFTTISLIIFPLLLIPYLNKNKKSFADLLSNTYIKNS